MDTHQYIGYDCFDSSYEDEECDAASIASAENAENESDSDFLSIPEKILAENHSRGIAWYLIKWENFPLGRSSWEIKSFVVEHKHILDAWEEEKILHLQGKKAPFDVNAFAKAVDETEKLEKGRRNLRRWKRQVKGIVAAVTASKVN